MKTAITTALMAATALPDASSGAPEWIHLLPATDQPICTRDGRGPYRVISTQQVIADSLADLPELPIDENHSTDIAAPLGQSAPARGWIVALEAREDGIWGKVNWTRPGRALVAGQSYRFVSPVIGHTADGRITRILRASLVNKPNLRGLTALNQEGAMTLHERLTELLGLNAASDEDAVFSAVSGLTQDEGGVALQSQMAEIGAALGVQGADPAEIINAAKAAVSGDPGTITALQAELASVTQSLNAMTEGVARDKATEFVDGAIRAGRVGLKPLRDHYIARHMADPDAVSKEVSAMPILGGGKKPAPADPDVSSHAETVDGLVTRANEYQARMAEAGHNITYAAAVTAVSAGKDKK